MGSSCFILQFVFDFRKDNLMILAIIYLFPYQRPILLDFLKDNLMILEKKSLSLSKTNSPLLKINFFKAYQIWISSDLWINILYIIFSLTYLFLSNLSYAVGQPIEGLGTPDESRTVSSS